LIKEFVPEMVSSALVSSSSAPEVRPRREHDRSRLQSLLSRAVGVGQSNEANPKKNDISIVTQVLRTRAPPGGTPFRSAPPIRISNVREIPSSSTVLELVETKTRCSSSAAPVVTPAAPRSLTPRSRKAAEDLEKLLGVRSDGKDAQHWNLILEVDKAENAMRFDLERQARKQAQERTAMALKQQVEESRRLANAARKSLCQWGQKLKDDAERFKEEERLKHQQSFEALRRHNEAQSKHIEDQRRRKAEEKQAEEKIMDEMRRRADAAEKDHLAKQARQRTHQQKVKEELSNAVKAAVAQKEQKRKDEAQFEADTMRQYKSMLDEQERQRRRQHELVKEKQKANQASYEAGAGNDLATKRREDEERAFRCQEERTKKEEEDAALKRRKLRQLQMDSNFAVKMQLEEHARKREQEREDSFKQRIAAEYDAVTAAKEEVLKAHERRARARDNQAFLLKQISELASGEKIASQQMTAVEKSMNRDRLMRAQNAEGLEMMLRCRRREYPS